MNDIIKLLPDSVANQIAAGEVIQRPASVIKELVENSVDAGATSIEIVLKDAGRTLIQVIDNGFGMSETDARMAFERHATSKINDAQDLFTLQTMGFRGEALASIAAVAQIEMRTKRSEDSVGTRIEINGSQVVSQEPVATSTGTNLMVKNLFYTVPARRRFLKKDSVELAAIMREFERLALVNPTLMFTLTHNGQILHQLMRATVKQRICDLFGKNLDKQLIPVETDTSIVRLSGFIGLPANARKKNALQYLLINGRNMRHPVFHKAILECYAELIPADCQPNYFIFFSVDPSTIDVNIHPTKNEIKFENEFGIRQILVAAVRESLGKFSAMPGIDFDMADSPDIPVFSPNPNAEHGIEIDPAYNPFNIDDGNVRGFDSALSGRVSRSSHSNVSNNWSLGDHIDDNLLNRDWEKLYDEFEKTRQDEFDKAQIVGFTSAMSSKDRSFESQTDSNGDVGQLELPMAKSEINDNGVDAVQILNTYIAAPCRSGMFLIDQNRAHIRILYDRYIGIVEKRGVAVQRVMFPEVVELTSTQNVVLESIIDEISQHGFDLSPLGDNSWSVNGVPSEIGNANPRELIERLLESAENDTLYGEVDTLAKKIALTMAKTMAIKSGQRLSRDEASTILADLMKSTTPNYTPDGQNVLKIIGGEQMDSLFGRR